MIRRIGHTRRYEPVQTGLRAMTALLVVREKPSNPCSLPLSHSVPRAAYKIQSPSISITIPSKRPYEDSSMNSASPPDLPQIFLSGFAPKRLPPRKNRRRPARMLGQDDRPIEGRDATLLDSFGLFWCHDQRHDNI
jgi:hypothetical protein